MGDQVKYYNEFGNLQKTSILNCPEPEIWTTDYLEQGPVYMEMKDRIARQQELIGKHFSKELAVLDIGCGYGRQASWLARSGYEVLGIDTSNVFIAIARQLFNQNGWKGDFVCANPFEFEAREKYRQVILFDVLEHFPQTRRTALFSRICDLMNTTGVLIVSVPVVRNRLSSHINNSIVKRIMGRFEFYRKKEEHPYPIPSQKEILRMTKGEFRLLEYVQDTKTTYYVFRKSG